MLLNLIKKLTKKILYNEVTHFYNQKYITYKNIKNKFYKKKKFLPKMTICIFFYKRLEKTI